MMEFCTGGEVDLRVGVHAGESRAAEGSLAVQRSPFQTKASASHMPLWVAPFFLSSLSTPSAQYPAFLIRIISFLKSECSMPSGLALGCVNSSAHQVCFPQPFLEGEEWVPVQRAGFPAGSPEKWAPGDRTLRFLLSLL